MAPAPQSALEQAIVAADVGVPADGRLSLFPPTPSPSFPPYQHSFHERKCVELLEHLYEVQHAFLAQPSSTRTVG